MTLSARPAHSAALFLTRPRSSGRRRLGRLDAWPSASWQHVSAGGPRRRVQAARPVSEPPGAHGAFGRDAQTDSRPGPRRSTSTTAASGMRADHLANARHLSASEGNQLDPVRRHLQPDGSAGAAAPTTHGPARAAADQPARTRAGGRRCPRRRCQRRPASSSARPSRPDQHLPVGRPEPAPAPAHAPSHSSPGPRQRRSRSLRRHGAVDAAASRTPPRSTRRSRSCRVSGVDASAPAQPAPGRTPRGERPPTIGRGPLGWHTPASIGHGGGRDAMARCATASSTRAHRSTSGSCPRTAARRPAAATRSSAADPAPASGW